MTQEELDRLLAGDIDDEDVGSELEEEVVTSVNSVEQESGKISSWDAVPPAPDNKMVHQLEDVTRDSEINATELFDKLDSISQILTQTEEKVAQVLEVATKNIEAFNTLVQKFPNVEKFGELLAENETLKDSVDAILMDAQMAQDEIMMMMDMMQFQDIHRQKIERVINVMRALSRYMSSLFEGKIEDEKRVSSAVYIHGDKTGADVVSSEDIESLIDNLGKK